MTQTDTFRLFNPIKMDGVLFSSTQQLIFCFYYDEVLLQLVYTKINIVRVFLSPWSYQSIGG